MLINVIVQTLPRATVELQNVMTLSCQFHFHSVKLSIQPQGNCTACLFSISWITFFIQLLGHIPLILIYC